jgi:hypothetical protein
MICWPSLAHIEKLKLDAVAVILALECTLVGHDGIGYFGNVAALIVSFQTAAVKAVSSEELLYLDLLIIRVALH